MSDTRLNEVRSQRHRLSFLRFKNCAVAPHWQSPEAPHRPWGGTYGWNLQWRFDLALQVGFLCDCKHGVVMETIKNGGTTGARLWHSYMWLNIPPLVCLPRDSHSGKPLAINRPALVHTGRRTVSFSLFESLLIL